MSEPLRLAGRPLCGEKLGPVLGVIAAAEDDLPWYFHEAARRRFHTREDEVRLFHVEPGQAAADAGLRADDVVVAVDGRPVRSANDVLRQPDQRIGEALRFSIRRGERPVDVQVESRLGCFAAAAVLVDPRVNAYVGAGSTWATSGLMAATNDDELAVVMGHELAHHVLGTGSRRVFEADADYLGLYLAASAGFEVSVAPRLWEQWALRTPGSIHDEALFSHPGTPERMLALESAVIEIREKQEAGRRLEPELPE